MTKQLRHVSRRFGALAFAMAALVARGPDASAGTGDQPIVVKLDHAKLVKLPDRAQTLIVGNPIVADVTLLRSGGSMVVTGKGFGETNLIVLDKTGSVVAESTIRVEAETGSLLIVQRGAERESYSCSPRCQPTVQLGDSKAFEADAAAQIQARNGMALPQGAQH